MRRKSSAASLVRMRKRDALAAGLDRGERSGRVVGVEESDLRGHLGVERAEEEAVVLGPPDPEVEAVVGFLEHHDVFRGVCAHPVTPELERAHRLVHPDVEDGGIVVRPRHSVGRLLDGLG
jgi:hypothetical protein